MPSQLHSKTSVHINKFSIMLANGVFCLFLGLLTCASAQFPNCTKADTAFCESPVSGVSSNSIIFRCVYDQGEASPGNCNDDLADVPPVGVKYASCWQSSPTAGDAQCTYECVAVTWPNGTSFYPLGCNQTTVVTTTGVLVSTSLSYASTPTAGSRESSTGTGTTPSSTHSSAATAVQIGTWGVIAWVGTMML
ncbi:hypothetical protein L207DRAFT_71781 [Hyaloscypha variabilis F]|uniref:Ig-like domain-containing protein n=1 Tax=Hyaloscypha variabilis (strain UAMH 11265 / GT02V1 / F) TaxID=1149755 RepID=A0A2J6RF88_HYAVF|nr:hypothetical protein L207DRAFT_71781 [Hyaloscypha variabilis F]